MGLVLLLALGVLLLFPSLGSAPFERAEIYFMDGARSMVERGDYLVPYFRDEPFFDKPPLAYWLQAGAFRVFGFTPAAARGVSALAALVALLATVWLGTLLFDRRTALAGGLVLATTLAFMGFGRIAMSDMLLSLWSTLCLALAVAAYRPGASAWIVPLLGATLGLGFLTKGPVALLLPGLGILLWLWRRRSGRLPAGAATLAGAAVLFAVFGLTWFAALVQRLGWAPLEYFFLHENLERFAGATYDAGQPAWYYPVTYLAEGLPWSLFLPLIAARELRRGGLEPGRDGARFLLGWVGLILIPLSFSRGKIDYYLLPAYPALSLLVGRFFVTWRWGHLERIWSRCVLLLLGGLLVLLAILPTPLPEAWQPGELARFALTGVSAIGGVWALAVALRPTRARVLAVLSAVGAAHFFVIVTWFIPAFRAAQPNAAIVKDVVRERLYQPDAGVVLCRGAARAQRDILFYARVPVVERCDVWSFASAPPPFMLLADGRQRETLTRVEGIREVRTYHYVPADVFTLRGLLSYPKPQPLTLMANYPTEDPVAERKRKRDRKRALRTFEALGLQPPD